MPSHHSLSYSVCTPPSVSPEGPHAVLSGLWRLWGFPYASGTRHFDCAVSVNLFPLHRPRLAVHFFLQVSRLQSVWTLPSFPLQHSGMRSATAASLTHTPISCLCFFLRWCLHDFLPGGACPESSPPVFSPGGGALLLCAPPRPACLFKDR